MQALAKLCVERPVFAWVLTLLVVVLGIASYDRLGVDRFPKIDIPVVTVTTVLPGASPEDVETEITDRIEAAVNTVPGIDELRSVSSEGVSVVIANFDLSKDTNVAAQEVRDRVNTVLGQLPDGTEEPVVGRVDPGASPVVFLSLSGEGLSTGRLTEVAERTVKRRLESLKGVGEVTVIGGQRREIAVQLDPIRLRARNVTATEVAAAIGAQNITLPGGRVDNGHDFLTLRVQGRITSTEELGSVAIRSGAAGVVRLRDVAEVVDGESERASVATWNGENAVVLSIKKQSDANTIEVVDNVVERIDEMASALPAGVKLQVLRDESLVIRTSTHAVTEHLVLGSALAALIVLVFLGNFRSTIIASLAIPTSVIGTFTALQLSGYTLNTITLLALALAVGIVIDDAIVVLENIYRFVEEKGMHPRQAAVEATAEIGLAVLATTLSLIAVFLPVAFLGGIPGRFLSSFGWTMAYAIAISLFVSFTLTPMLASRWLEMKKPGDHRKTALERVVDVVYRPIERVYVRILRWTMARRWVIVVASVASLAMIPRLAALAPKGFLPNSDEARFEVTIRAPEGASLAWTELVATRVADDIRETLPEATGTLITIGDDAANTVNYAKIFVKLTNPETRERTQDELKNVVRTDILPAHTQGMRTAVVDVPPFSRGANGEYSVQMALSGPDLDALGAYADDVLAELRKYPGAVDVDSTSINGKPEYVIRVDRGRAADLGVRIQDVAMAVRLLVGGQEVSSFTEDGERYEIRARAARSWRDDTDALDLLTVNSSKGTPVPLSALVASEPDTGPSVINRLSRQRQLTLLANVAPGYSQGQVSEELARIVKEKPLPPGADLVAVGTTKLMKETGQGFVTGLLLAMVFMYLVLAAQLESWIHPVTILLTLPLTLPFALVSILITGQQLNLYAGLGIFVLFGVVKKNAILQVDHTNHLRDLGMPLDEAIVQANRDRLRPILMTTLAFVAGMVPLVTAEGVGSAFSRATAGVVVGGQTLSLLLTLLATPVAYSYFDDLRRLYLRFFPEPQDPTDPVEPPALPAK